jgi:serine/threonine protein kinase
MSDSINQEKEIFGRTLELPPEERAAYLREACKGDEDLRHRVQMLVDAYREDSPALKTRALSPSVSAPLSEGVGTLVGRYKLLEQIGEGGMGAVYMAEQQEPVRRRVALKIIKLGMDTKQVIARFDAERQALALMDHPNIATVRDAGATETGRPYFVMDLVRGIPITRFCDEHRLSTRERLELFIQVCRAIQHAHHKGIIHRDIKPSNILVTVNDGVPVPKVIDFGIAKATTQQRLTDKTMFTAFTQFSGTPAYMSPEQAEMTSLDIDTRSDVYALGVLLYELLTGRTPFDTEQLLAAGLDEMRRTIREEEPVRPSTRLSGMAAAELTTTARQRHAEAPRLIHLLRGDLDWIVMNALEKDRSRRYETAHALAEDLERYLRHDPVLAAPPGLAYRSGKFWRRHRSRIVTTAVVTALVIALGATVWQYQRSVRGERIRWAQEAALPEILNLVQQADYAAAYALAQQAKAIIPGDPALAETPLAYRDWMIKIVKDLRRSIDYLETRDDLDSERIAFCGNCWGAMNGVIMLAVEDRIDTGILVLGGIPPAFGIDPFAQPLSRWQFDLQGGFARVGLSGKRRFDAPREIDGTVIAARPAATELTVLEVIAAQTPPAVGKPQGVGGDRLLFSAGWRPPQFGDPLAAIVEIL